MNILPSGRLAITLIAFLSEVNEKDFRILKYCVAAVLFKVVLLFMDLAVFYLGDLSPSLFKPVDKII